MTDSRHVELAISHDDAEPVPQYDTRFYFNVRSKADMSQLNLPHGTDNYIKSVKQKKKLKSKSGCAQK